MFCLLPLPPECVSMASDWHHPHLKGVAWVAQKRDSIKWHVCACVMYTIHICGGHARHGTCVGIKEQHWVSVLSFYLVWVSLLFITAYARLASVSSQGFSCLSLQPHHRNTDITDMRHNMQFFVSLGDLRAERHPERTSTVPMSLPLRFSNGIS